jgi:hypothetical protein
MVSPDELEKYHKENLELKKQIEELTGKTVDQLYVERAKRVRDVIELREPDRVPFLVLIDTQVHYGLPNSASYYDPISLKRTMRKVTMDLEPDLSEAGFPSCGAAMTTLDIKNCVWPGGPVPDNYEYQFIEGEYMKADEYDVFLNDPSGFMIRHYLPRVYGALMPLSKLPPLDDLLMGFEGLTPLFASPEFLEMAKRLVEAGRQVQEFYKIVGDAQGEFAQLGFPPFASFAPGGVGGAPFDTITSFLRGMKGSMLDMYRQPDKLIRACEVILERRIAKAIPADTTHRDYPQKIAIPLWRGDPKFMSDTQFKKFYWPGLKKSLQTHVDLGYVPVPFFEAVFGDRLECMLELPKGKILASVDAEDAVRAKEILGGHTSLLIRCPNSSRVWPLTKLESFLKDTIDKCGKGGGLILAVLIPNNAKIEDIKAMMKSVREYAYR